ncbi:hypothetical protein [Candidatus Liberibacter sp.]|uniref:hypothetical protein n=1 Tax=Candidatus Liberibacter sp. TaxID=34022 RepID=UPI0015F535AA|nr:hypothetical protein [Candidatus Liberibacter sp.]MBA5724473.1 hypothetical protein [Candidatus Liberibacter sp.]
MSNMNLLLARIKKHTDHLATLSDSAKVSSKTLASWERSAEKMEKLASDILQIGQEYEVNSLEKHCEKYSDLLWDYAVLLRASVTRFRPEDNSEEKTVFSDGQLLTDYMENLPSF